MFARTQSVIEHEPIEQEDYWEKKEVFKGVKEHRILSYSHQKWHHLPQTSTDGHGYTGYVEDNYDNSADNQDNARK